MVERNFIGSLARAYGTTPASDTIGAFMNAQIEYLRKRGLAAENELLILANKMPNVVKKATEVKTCHADGFAFTPAIPILPRYADTKSVRDATTKIQWKEHHFGREEESVPFNDFHILDGETPENPYWLIGANFCNDTEVSHLKMSSPKHLTINEGVFFALLGAWDLFGKYSYGLACRGTTIKRNPQSSRFIDMEPCVTYNGSEIECYIANTHVHGGYRPHLVAYCHDRI